MPYGFNPVTGNLDRIGPSGGGGGNITLVDNEGNSIQGNNFPIVGQPSNSAAVMESQISGSNFSIANNTWTTAYVVDQNTTYGQKGTFATLQEAIDAIVSDGIATDFMCGIIQMRPGMYIYDDPITIPENIQIAIRGNLNQTSEASGLLDVNITANFSQGAGSQLYLSNMKISGWQECSEFTYMENCSVSIDLISSINTFFVRCLGNISSCVGSTNFSYCSGFFITIEDGFSVFEYCKVGNITHNGGQVILQGCSGVNISGSATGPLGFYCANATLSGQITDTVNNFFCSNISESPGSNIQAANGFFSSGTNPKMLRTIKGNCYLSKIIDADYILDNFDYFIGVLGNTGPVAITLPQGINTQSWKISDFEGTAGANNITISPPGGSLINGSATYIISSDYGYVEIIKNGSNYFVIGDN